MNNVRITAIRKASYPDLIAQYDNPIEEPRPGSIIKIID